MKRNLQFALILIFATVLLSGCVSSNGAFPQATANFTPRQTYAVGYDKLWNAILDTLDQNRITTTSVDKASGVIQTDYIAGPERFLVVAAQSTRYKYGIRVRNEADGTVRLSIVCKVESTMNGQGGSSQWNDVSPQNTALTKNLEAWLYEQIEQKIK